MAMGDRVLRAGRGVSVVQVVGPRYRVRTAGGFIGPCWDTAGAAEALAVSLGMTLAAPPGGAALAAEVVAAVAAERARTVATLRALAAGWGGDGGAAALWAAAERIARGALA
jgi:hypothetical protein